MNKQNEPRICEVLGVAVGEKFEIYSETRHYRDCTVTEGGCVRIGTQKVGGNGLCWAINHPDAIIRKPRFTTDEVAAMRVLSAAYGAGDIERGAVGLFFLPDAGMAWELPCKLFPSILPSQSISIAEIINCGAKMHG